ncbi:MAG: ATP-binding protein [Sulfuricurvum sp.]
MLDKMKTIFEELHATKLQYNDKDQYYKALLGFILSSNHSKLYDFEPEIFKKFKSELTDTLKYVLDKSPDSVDVIAKLSTLLVSLDQENIRFTVDAGIVDRLGKELVGRHETAVSELVKNGYDADAKIVSLKFIDAGTRGGTLVIEDDGEGMDRNKLINGFMRLSSSDKLHHPTSMTYHRRKAGRKGIGRFATQRLGNKLTILTQTTSSDTAIQLTINWDQFSTDTDLGSITNKIALVNKEREHGTTLTIEGLREGWTDAAINKVYKYISDLLQPFPLSQESSALNIDPGFKVKCSRIENGREIVIANEDITFFEHALAEIEGYVDHEGYGYFSIASKKLGIKEEIQLCEKSGAAELFEVLRNVHIKAYYYIHESGLIPKNLMSLIRENLKHHGGIRLYRNGFRVPPYGDTYNDWLGLDASVRRRVILAPHGNTNFFGFIEVLDEHGDMFEEQSSREGLLQNQAFEELQSFAYNVIISSVLKVAESRMRKSWTSQKGWEQKSTKEKIEEAVEELEKLIGEKDHDSDESQNKKSSQDDQRHKEDESERLKDAFSKFKQAKEENDKVIEEKIIELISEISMLRVLAGLGLTIGEFVHEIKFYQAALHSDADALIDYLIDSDEYETAKRLKFNLESLKTYTAYFDKAISQNVQRELENIELRDVVRPFSDNIKKDADASAIVIEGPNFEGFNLYTCPMHKSEWISILFNLYTNAKKAIKKANSAGKIAIDCGKTDDTVYLKFSDNGIGIPEDKKERIFDAFYTTSTAHGKVADDLDELRGTGLGLKIVRDIISGYGGSINVAMPKEGFVTTIQIEVPKKKEK